jgi:hypothetical protein
VRGALGLASHLHSLLLEHRGGELHSLQTERDGVLVDKCLYKGIVVL